jgi:Zn-dependent protease
VSDGSAAAARACDGCGALLPPALLACPACGKLVHAAALKSAAAEAAEAEERGDLSAALTAWRRALGLLPAGSVQHQRVAADVRRLSDRVGSGGPPAPAPKSGGKRAGWLGGLAAAGALVAKFKWALLFLLGKGKLLLVGLAQAKTLLTMALAMGVYASVWGWKFALGLIASMYVHEMGHVAALRRHGIPASAPMFIPGFGAFVRLNQHPATPGEDARVGLAGPVWGAVAAVVCLLLGKVTGWPIFLAIARAGAWVNLFNLLPVWQLDGGRGFQALSRRQRALVAAVLWALWLLAHDGLLVILAVAATARAAGHHAPARGDRSMLALYLALVVGLVALIAGLPGPSLLPR